MLLTSLCTQYYQFLLCQGILLGASAGFVFGPAFAIIGHYFFKKRATAMSLASTGSPIGGTIYPVILTKLIPKIGFAWAQRSCGFLSLALLAVAAVTIRPTDMKRKGTFLLLGAFKKSAYSLQVAALFMTIVGYWTPYYYLAEYGIANGLKPDMADYLFAIVNAGSFVGRIIGGVAAGYAGQFNVITCAIFFSSTLLFVWLGLHSATGLIVLSVLFGAMSGVVLALMMSIAAHTADHPSKVSQPRPHCNSSSANTMKSDRHFHRPIPVLRRRRRTNRDAHLRRLDPRTRLHCRNLLQRLRNDGRRHLDGGRPILLLQ
jgi:MFS family permease